MKFDYTEQGKIYTLEGVDSLPISILDGEGWTWNSFAGVDFGESQVVALDKEARDWITNNFDCRVIK